MMKKINIYQCKFERERERGEIESEFREKILSRLVLSRKQKDTPLINRHVSKWGSRFRFSLFVILLLFLLSPSFPLLLLLHAGIIYFHIDCSFDTNSIDTFNTTWLSNHFFTDSPFFVVSPLINFLSLPMPMHLPSPKLRGSSPC